MTNLRTAAQQALEALEDLADCGAEAWSEQRPCVQIGREAITVLRAALTEPVQELGTPATVANLARDIHAAVLRRREGGREPTQEPVAWMEPPHGAIRANPNYKFTFPSQLLHWRIPLYTTPPQRRRWKKGKKHEHTF